ncbi:hypothetical protein L596_002563 [Steinernema carpocapsae]|uniref:Uncharacterized protein n=1 Tax=Steinernema carpocapsae TaxID=34508 RepID=A0A4U8UPZ5_STECR|nr:hypothetical protein L596_002563 [Steinernema carpocapsae]
MGKRYYNIDLSSASSPNLLALIRSSCRSTTVLTLDQPSTCNGNCRLSIIDVNQSGTKQTSYDRFRHAHLEIIPRRQKNFSVYTRLAIRWSPMG